MKMLQHDLDGRLSSAQRNVLLWENANADISGFLAARRRGNIAGMQLPPFSPFRQLLRKSREQVPANPESFLISRNMNSWTSPEFVFCLRPTECGSLSLVLSDVLLTAKFKLKVSCQKKLFPLLFYFGFMI
jgi:hypothetical protein